MIMDKKKLENFQEAMKPMIDQNLEGLLYDLDLLPEQLQTEIDGKRYSAIVNMRDELNEKRFKKGWNIGFQGGLALGLLIAVGVFCVLIQGII